VVCMGFGSCTVSIFSCPATRPSGWVGSIFFFGPYVALTLTLIKILNGRFYIVMYFVQYKHETIKIYYMAKKMESLRMAGGF
jgi:hypothetical protein